MEDKTISFKRGRPPKYTKETPRRVIHYIKKCQQSDDFPTIEHLSSELGVGTRTLYAWEEAYSDFQHTMDMLRDAQRDLLIRGGLTNKYNSRFASFLLKANHGMQDKQPPISATQNNYMNISPELMAEAIKLTREKDTTFMQSEEVSNT
jgi:hypothetical protein